MSPLQLPVPPAPLGAYDAIVVRRGPVGFVSGQFPIQNGALAYRGRVGADLTLEEAKDACRIAALNALGHVHAATGGFARLEGLLRLEGFVASAPGFLSQPDVLDVASALFREVLGERGRHARTAFSVAALPLDAAVELCLSFAMLD